MVLSSTQEAVLTALCYGEVFHFPLLLEEIYRYLPDKRATNKDILEAINHLIRKKQVLRNGNYFFLASTNKQVLRDRQMTHQQSQIKLDQAKKSLIYLRWIPSLLFIGVSGSVAADSADDEADIDLFIICEEGTLWVTRLLTYFVLSLLGRRRAYHEKNPNGKLCANFFITDQALSLPKKRQNVYTAHEIAQVVPLFSRKNTYLRFWQANKWLSTFLPHAYPTSLIPSPSAPGFFIPLFRLIDRIVFLPQRWYMSFHQTREEISHQILAFHPTDHMQITLDAFSHVKETYFNLPTRKTP